VLVLALVLDLPPSIAFEEEDEDDYYENDYQLGGEALEFVV